MALTNSQFESIMRDYSRRQALHRHLREERVRKIRAELPRIREIEEEIASSSVQSARHMLLDSAKDEPERLRAHIAQLGAERTHVLTEAGYPSDYLEMTYDCPLCKDQGMIDGQKCRCFKQAEIDLLYTQSNLKHILEKENFDTFRIDYYSPQPDLEGGSSPRERMCRALDICHRFVRDFDTEFSNLFLYGDTGVGKTFLSHCIARELLDSTHSVIYFSAQGLVDAFAQKRFRQSEEADNFGDTDTIYSCDLLIIDDLGTEMTNSFVSSELFVCINERLAARKSTIISTNLSLKTLKDIYSERIFSRISSSYTLIKLFGNDIRLLKKAERLSDHK